MNYELKSCPFCGGDATLTVFYTFYCDFTASVVCNHCQATTKSARFLERKEAADAVVTAWNRRAL